MRARWAMNARRRKDDSAGDDDAGNECLHESDLASSMAADDGALFDCDELLQEDAAMVEPDSKTTKVEYNFVSAQHDPTRGVPQASSSEDPLNRSLGNMLIKQTNTLQFKYPWEKGYLGRFFGAESLPGLDPPRIAPGNLNGVEMHVEATDLFQNRVDIASLRAL